MSLQNVQQLADIRDVWCLHAVPLTLHSKAALQSHCIFALRGHFEQETLMMAMTRVMTMVRESPGPASLGPMHTASAPMPLAAPERKLFRGQSGR